MAVERLDRRTHILAYNPNQMTGNKNATGDTPVASGELLRLGLNQ